MVKILEKMVLGPGIKSLVIDSPLIARKSRPGQFVVLRISERGERIPLTIADWNTERGTIKIVFQEVGKTTKHLGSMNVGDEIMDVVGPMGQPSEIKFYGTVAIVAGGVGVAEAYPIARALKSVGNKVIAIIGARSKDLLIMIDEIKRFVDELFVTTDDGSTGRGGLVTDQLRDILNEGMTINRVITIGPAIMMKAVAEVTRKFNVPTVASLNPIMIDATGMCGVCRVYVGGETKFTCIDGPEFDAHKVDFDLLILRLNMYKDKEQIADRVCS